MMKSNMLRFVRRPGLLVAIWLLGICRISGEYAPAVGIPDPAARWSGLDPVDQVRPADPASWPAAAEPNFYYIDNTHARATDSGNPNGCPSQPRMSMPTSLSAGAVVVLRGGPYSPANYTSLSWDGEASAPIWISGDSAGRTEFRNGWRLRTASYLFIENIRWIGPEEDHLDLRAGAAGQKIHHVAIRNCEAVGNGVNSGSGALFSIGNSYDSPVQDVVYYKCTARDGGDWKAAAENDKHGFSVGRQMHHVWWIGCEAYHLGGDGFGNGHDANHTTFQLFYDSCKSYECRENAIDLKEVHAVVVSGCEFFGFIPSGTSEGAAVVIHYGPNTGEGIRDVWLINNRVHDSTIGMISTETTDSWWIGNLVWNCGVGLSPDRGGGNLRLWNNTVYNCRDGIRSQGSVDSLDLRNNIVMGCSGTHLSVDSAEVCAASGVSNELYFQPGASVSIVWEESYRSVAAWQNGSRVAEGSKESDPKLADVGRADFRPLEGGPAVDAGFDWRPAADNAFMAIFSVKPTWADANRVGRSGGRLDIGALELGGEVGRPSAVRNVRLPGIPTPP